MVTIIFTWIITPLLLALLLIMKKRLCVLVSPQKKIAFSFLKLIKSHFLNKKAYFILFFCHTFSLKVI